MNILMLLFSSLLFIMSCSGPNKTIDQANQEDEKIKTYTLKDLIPEDLSDSLKVVGIKTLMTKIGTDTTLVQLEYTDSLKRKYYAYSRNDSILQISTGKRAPLSGTPQLYDFTEQKSAFFFNDSLVAVSYHCNYFRHTGSCNPVSARSDFFWYGDRLIYQYHKNKIGSYAHCGCQDLSSSADRIKRLFEDKFIDFKKLNKKR